MGKEGKETLADKPGIMKTAHLPIACSKRSDSGERCRVKKAMKSRGGLGREVREEFLTKVRSGIPDPGIPSDWLILTVFVNSGASSITARNAIWPL